MHRTSQIRIRKGHRLYPFCREICTASARLFNRGNYLVRQYATSLKRMEEEKELTENQKTAYDLIRSVTAGTKFEPKNTWLGYGQMDFILKATEDPDYRSMPSQANQQTLKLLIRSYKSFFESLRMYQQQPDRFCGRPKLPGYKKKGSCMTAALTNQICTIKEEKYLKFPGTKATLNLGKIACIGKLKEVRICPHADEFVIHVVLEVEDALSGTEENPLLTYNEAQLKDLFSGMDSCPYRVASIDPGTRNLCAVTTNCGVKPFLIRGGLIKARNNYYNKKLAMMRSEAMQCNGRHTTRRISRHHEKRNRIMKDLMHKVSHQIAQWAEENQIDLVILGHNLFQKQNIQLGHENNQTFVQIPFYVLAYMLRYKLNARGIAFLETEEAYTSKADFLAGDPIPAYEKEKEPPKMSGKRIHRGLYRHKNGYLSNADINGAGNIMRKVFPNVTEWDKGIVDMPYAVGIA